MNETRNNIQITKEMLEQGHTKEEIVEYILTVTDGKYSKSIVESAVTNSIKKLKELGIIEQE